MAVVPIAVKNEYSGKENLQNEAQYITAIFDLFLQPAWFWYSTK